MIAERVAVPNMPSTDFFSCRKELQALKGALQTESFTADHTAFDVLRGHDRRIAGVGLLSRQPGRKLRARIERLIRLASYPWPVVSHGYRGAAMGPPLRRRPTSVLGCAPF